MPRGGNGNNQNGNGGKGPKGPPIIDQSFSTSETPNNGYLIGDIQADVNPNKVTWSIVSGNYDLAFSIDPLTGELYVADGSLIDYETEQSRTLIVQVTEGAKKTYEATVTIDISDVNERPSAGDPVQASVLETVDDSAVLASVTATDPDTLADSGADATNDAFNDLSYAITGGDPDGLFEIDGYGNISLAEGKALDYETAQQHVLTVTVTDGGGLSDTAQVTINVTDENEQPSAGNPIQTSVVETVNDTTILADVDGTDPDILADTDTDPDNDTFNDLAYSITDGNDDGLFEIDPNTGEISLVAGESLDYETDPQHVLEVTVSDGGGLSDTTTVSINLADEAVAAVAFTNMPADDPFGVHRMAIGDPDFSESSGLPWTSYTMIDQATVFTAATGGVIQS